MISRKQANDIHNKYLKSIDQKLKLDDIKNRFVGALAYDIRQNWKDPHLRLSLISEYGDTKVTANDLYKYGGGAIDGRYFRDSWDGPYGTKISHNELKILNIDEDVFECSDWETSDNEYDIEEYSDIEEDTLDNIKKLALEEKSNWVNISPGIRVPKWVSDETEYDKNGCPKEMWWDR